MLTTLYTLPDGDGQTVATVGMMRQLATAGALTPDVRHVAAFLAQGLGRNQLSHADAIAGWVAQHTHFLPDPSVAEALVPPDILVGIIADQGFAQVDCDDVAMLAAALGLSIGLRARFVVVSFLTVDAPYEHVWAELSDAEGSEWVVIDPPRPLQGFPPIGRHLIVEV